VITITGSPIARNGNITIFVPFLPDIIASGALTNANVVISDTAVAANWTRAVTGGRVILTSTGGPTAVNEKVTVTFTGAANPWVVSLPGGEYPYITAVRGDELGADYFTIAISTQDPTDLIITEGLKINATNRATSPVITITGADIVPEGTISIDLYELNAYVASGHLTDANVMINDSAAHAVWTRKVIIDEYENWYLILKSTGGRTVSGETVTVTFTGATNPWIANTDGEKTVYLYPTRTDGAGGGTIPFVIETLPPSGYIVDADFSASQTSDIAPLVVTFTDTSLGHPTSWSWDFGDGGTSASRNPSHTYNDVGTYTVSLTATNAYGSNTKTTPWNYIHVLNGAVREANTAIEGLIITNCHGPQTITVNTSILTHYTLSPDNSVLEIQPTGSGFTIITIYAMNRNHFSRNGNLITGNPTGVHLVSDEIKPSPGFSSRIGTNASFNYSIDLASYPCNAILSTKIWEGVIPEYDNKFRWIASNNSAFPVGTAYTAKITKTNFPSGTRVKVHMSVDSYWRTFIGDPTSTIFIWHIADDGKSGQIFPTTHLYTDPVNNLDFFEAESPSGLSTFGLSSLTGSNNPFQIVAFVAAAVIAPAAHNPGSPAVVQTMLAPVINQTTLPDPGTTAKIYANADGVITQATKLLSTDGLASFTIGKDIIAKNSSGMPLTSIGIRRIPAGELPAGLPGGAWSFAGMAYDIQPDGATFSPSASLSFTVPQAQWSKEFAVQQYDSATGTWQVLPGSYIPETGMITVQVSHVCHFALFAKSTEIEKAATPEPTIIVASKSPIQTNVEMYSWIISSVVQNPVIIVIVLAALAAVAYFGWWKRRL
jgi:PKD repeat protein